jgi:hypothetical protein
MNGWPFLIARGRRRGYSVLLAPAFLHEEYGLLEEVAGPVTAAEPVRVAAARSSRGHDLGVVWSEHRVTAADIADGTEPRDEHSRPLRLLYGFVCQETVLSRPADTDLARALAAGLDTYRRFLAGEQRFTVESSAPFDLHTAGTSRPAAPPEIRPRRNYAIPLALVGVAAGFAIGIAVASGGDETPAKTPTECTTTKSSDSN